MTFDDFLAHLGHVTGLRLVGASPTTPIDAEVDSLGLVLLLMDLDDRRSTFDPGARARRGHRPSSVIW